MYHGSVTHALRVMQNNAWNTVGGLLIFYYQIVSARADVWAVAHARRLLLRSGVHFLQYEYHILSIVDEAYGI